MHASDDNASPQPKRLRAAQIAWGVLGGLAVVALGLLWAVDPAENHLPLCGLHAVTGLHCPGCGVTRATHALLHGRLREAAQDNALWVGALPLVAWLVFWEFRRHHTGKPPKIDLLKNKSFYVAVAVVVLAFFLLRNLPGWPWELLRPIR